MKEKIYKSVNGQAVEISPEEYAQYEKDRIDYETITLPIEVRQQRDALLTACDWTQVLDIPQATREAWAAYRQALRDVPQQSGFPLNVVWPQKP